jgi:hypothetical protein
VQYGPDFELSRRQIGVVSLVSQGGIISCYFPLQTFFVEPTRALLGMMPD